MNRNITIQCPEYRLFVKGRGCLVCGGPIVDFDHLKARGMGEGKRNDLTGIPLCRGCHARRGQLGDEKFQAKYKINLWQELAWLLIEFFALDEDRRTDCIIEIGRTVIPGPWGTAP